MILPIPDPRWKRVATMLWSICKHSYDSSGKFDNAGDEELLDQLTPVKDVQELWGQG